jgi:hypothetical protein
LQLSCNLGGVEAEIEVRGIAAADNLKGLAVDVERGIVEVRAPPGRHGAESELCCGKIGHR